MLFQAACNFCRLLKEAKPNFSYIAQEMSIPINRPILPFLENLRRILAPGIGFWQSRGLLNLVKTKASMISNYYLICPLIIFGPTLI